MQMYVNAEDIFPEKIVREVWLGVIHHDPC